MAACNWVATGKRIHFTIREEISFSVNEEKRARLLYSIDCKSIYSHGVFILFVHEGINEEENWAWEILFMIHRVVFHWPYKYYYCVYEMESRKCYEKNFFSQFPSMSYWIFSFLMSKNVKNSLVICMLVSGWSPYINRARVLTSVCKELDRWERDAVSGEKFPLSRRNKMEEIFHPIYAVIFL